MAGGKGEVIPVPKDKKSLREINNSFFYDKVKCH
jgi:hypothetical protein